MPCEIGRPSRHCTGFLLLPLLLAASLCGCGLPYYAQAVGGELSILHQERPITEVLQDPKTPPAVSARLRYVLRLRSFAQTALDLPVGDNYRDYADLHRPYVVWNVFAARPLSLTLKQWCFPFTGCVAYRGYFAHAQALRFAHHLSKKGYDVFVGGVPAYATLGYLQDPVLNTFLGYTRPAIAHLLFHELSHDLIYVPNATTFDESFADTLADIGVRRFLRAEGTPRQWRQYRQSVGHHAQITALMNRCRAQLRIIYADRARPQAHRRAAKRAALRALKADIAKLALRWHEQAALAPFLHEPFNNALLGAYASYESLVPAFKRLLALEDGQLPAFFRAVRWYAKLPRTIRDRDLRSRSGLVARPTVAHKARARNPGQTRRSRTPPPRYAPRPIDAQRTYAHDKASPF